MEKLATEESTHKILQAKETSKVPLSSHLSAARVIASILQHLDPTTLSLRILPKSKSVKGRLQFSAAEKCKKS